ncbi:hypothetical protein [uncultured Roseibium sp.]|uniref:hypothetical protein n=1 Tax=uncultured Roseibium sp. TaxID=1936171 RepID=UPI002633D7CA|nr:hypothetical protein [uncultured Roseibium sp.]
MRLMPKAILGTLIAFSLLFASVARAPGTMLSFDGDTITIEICTGTGVKTVTLSADGTPVEQSDVDCDFFATQIAALLNGAPPVSLGLVDTGPTTLFSVSNIALRRLTQQSHLIRGPPPAS